MERRVVDDIVIRPAVVTEQKLLEVLQLRASLTNAGDREALLAHPDAIRLIEFGGSLSMGRCVTRCLVSFGLRGRCGLGSTWVPKPD
jgi:hypothetical protein